MADIADEANDLAQQRIDDALAWRAAQRSQGKPNLDGVCAGCGDDIPKERLQVMPDASHCVRCQEILDRGGRR